MFRSSYLYVSLFVFLLISQPIPQTAADNLEFIAIDIIGSDGFDWLIDVEVDSENNFLTAGQTLYPTVEDDNFNLYQGPFYDRDQAQFDLIPLKDAYDDTYGGKQDGLLAKYSKSGELIWSTYVGGSGQDKVHDSLIADDDSIYIVGGTTSRNLIRQSTFTTSLGPSMDGLIAKLDKNGAIDFTFRLGGAFTDEITSIAIDSQKNIIAAGFTTSYNFPVLNAYQEEKLTGVLAPTNFLIKIDTNKQVVWSTHFGGSELEFPRALKVDSQDNIYMFGATKSSDFPVMGNKLTTFVNSSDIYVSKFDPNGQLLESHLLGGLVQDTIQGVAFDNDDNIVILGQTNSKDFPVEKAFDPILNSRTSNLPRFDVFLLKLTPNLDIVFSTFIGGTDDEHPGGIVVDENNAIYIVGTTYSENFPAFSHLTTPPLLNKGLPEEFQAGGDVFMTKFSPEGQALWSTFYGGEGNDRAFDVSRSSTGELMVIGPTDSTDSFATHNGTETLSLPNSHYSIFKIPDGNWFVNETNAVLDDSSPFDFDLIQGLQIIALIVSITVIIQFMRSRRETKFI